MNWETISYFDPTIDTMLKCPCCGLENMNPDTARKFDQAREIAGVAFTVNSACRCYLHNAKVSKLELSAHKCSKTEFCYAIDIGVLDTHTRFRVLKGLIKAGFKRIGIAKSFIHADDDPDKPQEVCWMY